MIKLRDLSDPVRRKLVLGLGVLVPLGHVHFEVRVGGAPTDPVGDR